MTDKEQIMELVRGLIAERDIRQIETARLLSIKQPEVSLLERGVSGGFSLERLIKFAKILGAHVELKIYKSV